ncbi:MAG: hypothetical protein HDR17_06065 [Lachnospiraceae bacterium]|nr:hypothetical protein [Lachnospiraceae bacterium]
MKKKVSESKKIADENLKKICNAKCVESEEMLLHHVDSEKLVKDNLKKFDKAQIVKSDKALYKSDTSSLSKHNKQYTVLLKAYVKDYKYNSENKKKHKEDLFKVAKALLILMPILTIIYMFSTLYCLMYNKIDVLDSLPGLFAALAALIGTFIVIPQMITEYLFNKSEEEHLTNIIGKIQDYDRNIRDGL